MSTNRYCVDCQKTVDNPYSMRCIKCALVVCSQCVVIDCRGLRFCKVCAKKYKIEGR